LLFSSYSLFPCLSPLLFFSYWKWKQEYVFKILMEWKETYIKFYKNGVKHITINHERAQQYGVLPALLLQ
jgi:hypothetical protein